MDEGSRVLLVRWAQILKEDHPGPSEMEENEIPGCNEACFFMMV